MKITEVPDVLMNTSPDDYEIDITHVIVHDEFMKREPMFSGKKQENYRDRAFSRLLNMGVEFGSDHNIEIVMVKNMVHITCPYDGEVMRYTHSSGNFSRTTFVYVCDKCHCEVSLDITEQGLGVKPSHHSK